MSPWCKRGNWPASLRNSWALWNAYKRLSIGRSQTSALKSKTLRKQGRTSSKGWGRSGRRYRRCLKLRIWEKLLSTILTACIHRQAPSRGTKTKHPRPSLVGTTPNPRLLYKRLRTLTKITISKQGVVARISDRVGTHNMSLENPRITQSHPNSWYRFITIIHSRDLQGTLYTLESTSIQSKQPRQRACSLITIMHQVRALRHKSPNTSVKMIWLWRWGKESRSLRGRETA